MKLGQSVDAARLTARLSVLSPRSGSSSPLVGALAQPAADRPSPVLPRLLLPNIESSPTFEEEIRTKSALWHSECIADWERETHMT
jgi:hypothetical protein